MQRVLNKIKKIEDCSHSTNKANGRIATREEDVDNKTKEDAGHVAMLLASDVHERRYSFGETAVHCSSVVNVGSGHLSLQLHKP